MVSLAKRYGITTPYTSYLVVPDSVMPVADAGGKVSDRKGGAKDKGGDKLPDVRFHLDDSAPPPALESDVKDKPVSVEVNPHLDDPRAIVAEGLRLAGLTQ